MTEPTVEDGQRPPRIEVVPRSVADRIVAEAAATILELERELEEVQQSVAGDAQRLDEAARFLLQRAEPLASEARAHRARVMNAARAEAATLIERIPAPTNGQL